MNTGKTKEEIQQQMKGKQLLSQKRIETKLKFRKFYQNKILWSKRKESSNKDIQIQIMEP